MRSTAILVLILLFSFRIYGQENDKNALLYNIGFSGLLAGIGGIINKEKNQKPLPIFFKAFYKGSLGGGLVYASKKIVYGYANTSNHGFLWPSKLLNSFGNSIVENGAKNKRILDKLHLNVGFIRFEFQNEKNYRPQLKILPLALYSTIYSATTAKFDVNKSLMSGHFVFQTSHIKPGNNGIDPDGRTFVNSITLETNVINPHKILAHEIIHVYQYEGALRLNAYFIKAQDNWLNHDSNAIKFMKRWIYIDGAYLAFSELYGILTINADCHYDNFFEKEANFYSYRYKCP